MRARAYGLAALLVALPCAGARAECEEASLSVGVSVRRCALEGLRWSIVSADLAAADVGVRVSQSSERGRTVDAWMAGVPGAVAAVQGGPFRFPGWDPLGLTIGEGEAWPGSGDDPRLAVLALDASGAGLIAPPEVIVPAEPWMRAAVSGVVVVQAGSPIGSCEGDACERRPRTAVGLSRDGRALVIVVAEGWTAASEGVSDRELGALARDAGAHDAIRIGEGATSVLATAGGAGAIASSDGAPRPTAAFLGIVDRGSGATGDLVGVVERRSDTMPLTAATIRVATTDGTTIAMSGTLTTGAYFRFPLPERTYLVTATHAGYRDACRVCTVERGRETWCSLFLDEGAGAAECAAPPRGVDAGVYPLADAGRGGGGRDAGRSDGGDAGPGLGGGCAVVRGLGEAGGHGATWLGVALAVGLAARSRRTRRGRRSAS